MKKHLLVLVIWIISSGFTAQDQHDPRHQFIGSVRVALKTEITKRQKYLKTDYESVALLDIARERLESGVKNPGEPDWGDVIHNVSLGWGYALGVVPSLRASKADALIIRSAYSYRALELCDRKEAEILGVGDCFSLSRASRHVRALNEVSRKVCDLYPTVEPLSYEEFKLCWLATPKDTPANRLKLIELVNPGYIVERDRITALIKPELDAIRAAQQAVYKEKLRAHFMAVMKADSQRHFQQHMQMFHGHGGGGAIHIPDRPTMPQAPGLTFNVSTSGAPSSFGFASVPGCATPTFDRDGVCQGMGAIIKTYEVYRTYKLAKKAAKVYDLFKSVASLPPIPPRDPKDPLENRLRKKLSELQTAQSEAVKTERLPDGRVRYYKKEAPSSTPGPTRGRARVIEHNPKTGTIRSWEESYNHKGEVTRVHPETINGQNIESTHYPLTGKEMKELLK